VGKGGRRLAGGGSPMVGLPLERAIDGDFLYALHCDHCAISNHSAAICHRMSAALNSTGGGKLLGQNFRVFSLE